MGYGSNPKQGLRQQFERAKSREAFKQEKMEAATALIDLSSSMNESDHDQDSYDADAENSPPREVRDKCDQCRVKQTDLDRMTAENRRLTGELTHLQDENHRLHTELMQTRFGASFLRRGNSDLRTKFYTGVPTLATFLWLANFVQWSFPTYLSVGPIDVLFIILMKLRLNAQNFDIANRFCICQTTVSDILNRCIPVLADSLKFLVHWPDKIDVKRKLPKVFRKIYRDVRVIIDCTEIFIERPGNLTARAATWSNYKSHNTLKYLVSITPCGSVSFISRAFGGRTSDKVVTQRCGFLDLLEYGDVILADRGFLVDEEIATRNCHLAIPSFTKGRTQLSQKDVKISRQISRVRIHVERAIERLKNFHIISSTMQLVMVPHADNILTICSAISNLQPKLVK